MTIIANPALLIQLVPVMIDAIKEGADIVERLTRGDTTALEKAQDWLGVTGDVADAIAAWNASKATAQTGGSGLINAPGHAPPLQTP